ncbi:MAG: hypothetical protein ACKOJF_04045 [Planctomycetaceae bacterium]
MPKGSPLMVSKNQAKEMTAPPTPSENANAVPARAQPIPLALGPLPGYLKTFGVIDLVFSALRLVATVPGVLALVVLMARSPTPLPIAAKIGPSVDLLLGLTGVTAGCLLLARSKAALPFGRIAVFLTAVSLPFHLLSVLTLFAQANGNPGLEGFPTGIHPGGLPVGLVLLLLRVILLGIYIGLLREFTKWLNGEL